MEDDHNSSPELVALEMIALHSNAQKLQNARFCCNSRFLWETDSKNKTTANYEHPTFFTSRLGSRIFHRFVLFTH
jgi:hypothetical protein